MSESGNKPQKQQSEKKKSIGPPPPQPEPDEDNAKARGPPPDVQSAKKKPMQKEPQPGKEKKQQQNPSKTPKKSQVQGIPTGSTPTSAKNKQAKATSAKKKDTTTKGQKSQEADKKEDVFQAVLLVDNFGCSIFGPDSPLTQEGLIPLANRKLIDYSLESLTVSGVQEIFLYCSSEAETIRRHIQESKWSSLPDCTINIVASEGALSLGDALRDFDAKGMLRNDFILMTAGVVTNLPLKPLLNIHRETVKKDKGAVMTLVARKMLPGHRSRPKSQNIALVVNSATKKLIAFDDKLSGKKLNVPLERIGEEMDVYLDCVDSGIAVCSSSVPPLFTDNFDFTSLSDFLRGILIDEETFGNSVYLHRVERGYANRVVDFDTFHGISCDVMQRWTYPVVPDLPFGSNPEECVYNVYPNFIYKGENVKIANGAEVGKSVLVGADSEISKGAKISHSVLGDNCKIFVNVEITDCHLGNNVVIKDGCKLLQCIITNNTVLECNTEIQHVLMMNGEKFEISLPNENDLISEASSGSFTGSDEYLSDSGIDDDYKIFCTEVMESLSRGYKENVATENLVLEINSSKYAYNMTFKEVTSGVCSGILSLTPKFNPEFEKLTTTAQWEKSKHIIINLKNLLVHYVKTNESQKDLLDALEEFSTDNKYFRPMLVQAIKLFYDEDILSEDAILFWYKNTSLYEAATELRIIVKPLVEWLENADTESEEE